MGSLHIPAYPSNFSLFIQIFLLSILPEFLSSIFILLIYDANSGRHL